ncbi:hypothetical protein [Nitrobacter winogradskyi]|uniref:Uncharacterized protein n=2 Tax=Nitrobacter winogradskyi TaxID=913 RepID=A0A4Y3W5G7_NITWI|nr:hypothetical protein [Nitrobacter winogradskyi]MCP1998801.1 hypothetical protein [Nitrobacter winogradskyi]GEC14277.1 hypothetical protein NWI01_01690 [Nitrobacter winogradskyi]
MTWVNIVAAILGPIGFIALARAWLGMAFNGQRDEWAGICAVVAIVSFGMLWLAGVK